MYVLSPIEALAQDFIYSIMECEFKLSVYLYGLLPNQTVIKSLPISYAVTPDFLPLLLLYGVIIFGLIVKRYEVCSSQIIVHNGGGVDVVQN
jgi:hypothetical protein